MDGKLSVIRPGMGHAPAVALVDPKYGHNAAGVLRACSAYGIEQLWITGDRVFDEWRERGRLPREERMKAYGDVDVFWGDYFLNAFGKDVTPIAVEVLESAEPLATFQYPANPLWVFGPEDSSIPGTILRHCHRRVIIPTRHCLNLAVAVGTVLYDWHAKRQLSGEEPVLPSYATLDEQRGFVDSDEAMRWVG